MSKPHLSLIRLEPGAIRLDATTGVPFYRQIVDQVLAGVATGQMPPGTQLPTVRSLAVELGINPNTVIRAYRELEIRGILDTHQGTGTFVSAKKLERDEAERERRLTQLVGGFLAAAGAEGYTVDEVRARLEELGPRPGKD